jgi:hypothetical protein
MRMRYLFGLMLVFSSTLFSSSTLYASNPFVGKWKIDQAKSQITGATDSVTAVGQNTWKFQYGSFSWTVKADGTNQPTPFGTTNLKVLSPTTWQFTDKNNGKPSVTDTWVLSADGKSMTRTYAGQKENGEPFSASATLKRTAGTAGFEGTWEATEVQMPFTEIDIEPNGDDGITLHVPADGTRYSLKFDGKEYPEEGPRIPPGTTVSAKMTGARTVQATTRLNGKVFDHETWEVSADGMTYTYTEHDAGTDKPAVIILHRSE